MGGQGTPWGGEVGGHLPKNGADFHINRTPIGCVPFSKLGLVSVFPSSANTPGMPACGGFSLVTRATGWFWARVPLVWVSEAKSNSILQLLTAAGCLVCADRWGSRGRIWSCPALQSVNNPPTDCSEGTGLTQSGSIRKGSQGLL